MGDMMNHSQPSLRDIDRMVKHAVESEMWGRSKEFDLYLSPSALDQLIGETAFVPTVTGVPPGVVVYNSPYGKVNLKTHW